MTKPFTGWMRHTFHKPLAAVKQPFLYVYLVFHMSFLRIHIDYPGSTYSTSSLPTRGTFSQMAR